MNKVSNKRNVMGDRDHSSIKHVKMLSYYKYFNLIVKEILMECGDRMSLLE